MTLSSGTALFADPISKEHVTGRGHPEQPARFDAAMKAFNDEGWTLTPQTAREANEDELALCHGREYIRLAEREIEAGATMLSTGDTNVSPRTHEVALRATGTVLNAVDAVFAGNARNAFCVVRPPGHHATPNVGMGFCVFNNIAVGARYAQKRFGAARVLIADWDVHHVNGTHDIFYNDGSVLFFSTHQYPWYPGTGAARERGDGPGDGATLNFPFPAGSGREEILGAFREHLISAASEFKPDLVMISAGFDSRIDDPLGNFTLDDQDFADLTLVMMEIADAHAGGRLVSVLEGGYNLNGLTQGIRAHVAALKNSGA